MSTLSGTSGYRLTRRRFLASAPALGAASLLPVSRLAGAEPPPEISNIRLVRAPAICLAPQFLAEQLLRLEGFSEVSYAEYAGGILTDLVESGKADMTMEPSTALIYAMQTHRSVVALAGIHAGCYELFGGPKVNAFRDLKGKTVGVYALGRGDHVLLSSMLAYVGMNPTRDVKWVTGDDAMQLFIDGKIDAFMGFAPQPHELRTRKGGKVLINTAVDRPWSQYFCCMLTVHRDFLARNPIATKRAMRALLKAADMCADQPERVARYLAEKQIEPRYEVALEVLKELPYRRWRDGDPEDTLRFHALRLHEVGMIRSMPQKIIAEGTDWRVLNALKKELKA